VGEKIVAKGMSEKKPRGLWFGWFGGAAEDRESEAERGRGGGRARVLD